MDTVGDLVFEALVRLFACSTICMASLCGLHFYCGISFSSAYIHIAHIVCAYNILASHLVFFVCVCVRACVCMCVHVRACVRVCVHVLHRCLSLVFWLWRNTRTSGLCWTPTVTSSSMPPQFMRKWKHASLAAVHTAVTGTI